MRLTISTAKEVLKYYKEKVRLGEEEKKAMVKRRKNNEERLKKNLDTDVQRFIKQGSYVMYTMVQHPENDYDIDDGAVFKKEDLKGERDGDKTALDARKMVCDALQDNKFNKKPEVLPNCVRVYYNEGYHIDVPVYREYTEENQEILELAAADWKDSNPDDVKDWFNQAVVDNSPDTTDGRQMRRMVCLFKKWSKSRSSWSLPSGLIFSTLVDQEYPYSTMQDDEAFMEILSKIKRRLNAGNYTARIEAIDEDVAEGDKRQARMRKLEEKLDTHFPDLEATLTKEGCSFDDAMKAWKKFFNDDWFLDQEPPDDNDEGNRAGILIGGKSNAKKVDKKSDGGRYALNG